MFLFGRPQTASQLLGRLNTGSLVRAGAALATGSSRALAASQSVAPRGPATEWWWLRDAGHDHRAPRGRPCSVAGRKPPHRSPSQAGLTPGGAGTRPDAQLPGGPAHGGAHAVPTAVICRFKGGIEARQAERVHQAQALRNATRPLLRRRPPAQTAAAACSPARCLAWESRRLCLPAVQVARLHPLSCTPPRSHPAHAGRGRAARHRAGSRF